MRLQRIYSSKLYVTSTRKDRIKAAMGKPYNKELILQISDYLDDDAKLELARAQKSVSSELDTENSDNGAVKPSSTEPSGGGSFSGNAFADFGDDELAGVEPMEEGGEAPAPEASEAPVEESTEVSATPIIATSDVWTTVEDVVGECDIIQGTLNSREDTKGVNRLQVKDSELWIYYKDDINLNDTMISVIETLNSIGYTYLTFSRLARSNNAIVFDINLNYQDDIKSQAEVDGAK